jgi:polyisoprenoid-binding protein YceI
LFTCRLDGWGGGILARTGYDSRPGCRPDESCIYFGGSSAHCARKFQTEEGSTHFDPATGQASGRLVVDATSAASGSGARDRRMQKNFLENEKFPEITFTPDHFEGRLSPDGESEIDLHGMFGIHGAEHEMTLQTTVQLRGDQLSANTHFVIPYVQWGMKNPSTLFLRVNDKVMIDLQAVGKLR